MAASTPASISLRKTDTPVISWRSKRSSTTRNKAPFSRGMIITSTDTWSSHAEAALADQTKEVQRVRLRDFAESTIDWSVFDFDQPTQLVAKPGKQPRKYQREAIDDVINGFQDHDRGKLIMACGTGKTFTALSLVEEHVPVGGSVLFLVPSIALLQQTLNEWTAQAATLSSPGFHRGSSSWFSTQRPALTDTG